MTSNFENVKGEALSGWYTVVGAKVRQESTKLTYAYAALAVVQ